MVPLDDVLEEAAGGLGVDEFSAFGEVSFFGELELGGYLVGVLEPGFVGAPAVVAGLVYDFQAWIADVLSGSEHEGVDWDGFSADAAGEHGEVPLVFAADGGI